MQEVVYQLSHYAPLVIFVASVLDIFFLTGLILYGGATLGAVGMMLMSGMITVPEVIIAALAGTLLGNQINYWVGRLFHNTNFVQKRLSGERAQKAEDFLRTRGLLLFMIVGRFITFFRPLHGLIIGTFNIKLRRFFAYDLILSFLWVTIWLAAILYGEKLWLQFFNS